MANNNRNNPPAEDKKAAEDKQASALAANDPNAVKAAEEKAKSDKEDGETIAEAEAAAAHQRGITHQTTLPNQPLESELQYVPTLEEWTQAGYTKDAYLAKYTKEEQARAGKTPGRHRGTRHTGEGHPIGDPEVVHPNPSLKNTPNAVTEREEALAKYAPPEKPAFITAREPSYAGDVTVTCLKTESSCLLGRRRYQLVKGREIEMDPSHAVELEQSGWVKRNDVID